MSVVCSRVAPRVVFSPSSVASTTPTEKLFTVSVTNQDSNCSDSPTFNLSSAVPSGWTGTFTNSALTVATGQSAQTTLSVVPASSAVSDNYTITATTAEASHAASSASAVYQLDASAPNPPTSLKAALSRKTKVNLSWSGATDTGSGVKDYLVFRNGAQVGVTSSLSYQDSPGSGTFSYTVKARDNAGNVSTGASPAASITVSSGGKK